MSREVRIQQRFVGFNGREQITTPIPVVLVNSNAWVMVRRADYRNAAPFVISRREWDALPIQSTVNPEGE